MNMDMDLDLNWADFRLYDVYGSYIFCLTGFGLDLNLIILFYTSSQLSVLFQSCRLLHSACNLFICCSGVSHICRNCAPCLYLDHIRSIDARYKPALLCIMSSKFKELV